MAETTGLSLYNRMAPAGTAARALSFAVLALAGSAVIAIAAKISVPFWPVPATLQTLAIFTIAALYGRNLAVATLLVYLAEGAAGLPVFTTGSGLAYMAGPTGGYLAAFVLAAAITGAAADRGYDRMPLALFAVNIIGTALILALGAAWIGIAFGWEKAIAWGVGPFIVTDVIKAALAAAIVPAGLGLAALIRR